MAFTAFISDLHLTSDRPAINRVFFSFLEDVGRQADALYILGDLFDYWAGDDELSDPLKAQVAAALAAVSAAGTPVLLMHGNRDFLLQDGFSRASGGTLIADPTVVDLYGVPTLLMHGDSLCTEDVRYQVYRRRVRIRLWQRIFLWQPLWLRRAEFERGRHMSEARKGNQTEMIMDVTPAAVEAAIRESGAQRMIHGHTHRPARHIHRVDGRNVERWVLSDWYQRGQYLRVTPEGLSSVELK